MRYPKENISEFIIDNTFCTTLCSKMVISKLCVGVGAECTVLSKFLHPSKKIDEVLVNRTAHHRLSQLIAIRKEAKRVNRRDQICIVFRHESFSHEIYCCQRYCKVLKEGAEVDIFSLDNTLEGEHDVGPENGGEQGVLLPDNFNQLRKNVYWH